LILVLVWVYDLTGLKSLVLIGLGLGHKIKTGCRIAGQIAGRLKAQGRPMADPVCLTCTG